MATPVTAVIGKLSPEGDYESIPVEPKLYAEALRLLLARDAVVTLRVRPPEALARIEDPARALASSYLEEIRTRGTLTAVMGQRVVRSAGGQGGRRSRYVDETETYPADKPFTVSLRQAMRLLQITPYCYLVEEVDDGKGALRPAELTGAPPRPGDVAYVEDLEAQLRAQSTQISQLTALVQQLAGRLITPDDDASSPEADDDTTTDDDGPPRPGRKSRR